MKILFFRHWTYSPGFGSFSDLGKRGIGGTEFQLLLHARAAMKDSHSVYIAGVTPDDRQEEGAHLLGAENKQSLQGRIAAECADAEIVFINSTDDLASLRRAVPRAIFIQVCQNGPHFQRDSLLDFYAFVGPGQQAYYSAKFRRFRHKFVPLFNVPPVNSTYSKVDIVPAKNQIIWVGALEKQGFRRWAVAMQKILAEKHDLTWVVCAPSYSRLMPSNSLPALIGDLDLPIDRILFKNLVLTELAREIKSSKALVASLGGEDGPVSYLDGHALGVPVVCGDDIIGLYANPPGTGLRATTEEDCYRALTFLLDRPEVAAAMGKLGKEWVSATFNEDIQYGQLRFLIGLSELSLKARLPQNPSRQSDLKFPLRYKLERLKIKLVEKKMQRA